MGIRIVVEIGFMFFGFLCLVRASFGQPIPFKGALLSPWGMAMIGLSFIGLAIVSLRSFQDRRKPTELLNEQELAEDLARQEQLYFEEHGEYPAETTARLLKEKQAKEERKLKKD